MTRFSLISATYDVETYLPDFLQSLDAQTFDHREVEVILVDDGSTDSSPEIIADWQERTDYSVTVIRQVNAGQGAARNAGLERASGTWVSFPDPDDILDPEYLTLVDVSLSAHGEAVLAATHLVDYWEDRDQVLDTHPLRFRFRGGTQVVDLDRFPRNIHLHAASAFFFRDRVMESDIRFDQRIRPVFEDAHFVQAYLLTCPERMVVFDADAQYLYRRRADGSSTLQTSGSDPRRYTDVLRYGLLDLLHRAAAMGPLPRWLQYAVLYDIFWTLRAEESLSAKTGHFGPEVGEEFFSLMAEIRDLLQTEAIEAFDIIRVSPTQRETLLHGFSDADWWWDFVVAEEYDPKKRLIKLRYHFTGEQPSEQVTFRGLPVAPFYAKTRSLKYLGRPLLNERILWVSARGTLTMSLNGGDVPIADKPPEPKKYTLRPSQAERLRYAPKAGARPSTTRLARGGDRLLTRMADSRLTKRRFAGAWVFMDRTDKAGDNAEHLFRFVRAEHPKRNAWFVLEKDSADWKRLQAEGVDRLVAYGSATWKALCLNAELLVSSHIDADVISPFQLSNGRKPTWDHIFLQHGVTMNDLSAWLNTKRPRMVVTTTEAEYAAMTGDGTPYILSAKEVALTGLPRYDRLAELDATPNEKRGSTITLMPTWRKQLDTALRAIEDPVARREAFAASEWWQQWSAFMASDQLREAAEAQGLRIRFMPHPGFEAYIDPAAVPDHVELVGYATHDVQQILVDTAFAVTDMSSVTIDAAFIDRPVIYFQFDPAILLGGSHVYKPGYFSFEADGFGPVASTLAEAVEATVAVVTGTHPDLAEFARRRAETFTLPRTENCRRTYKAIVRSLKAVSAKDAIGR